MFKFPGAVDATGPGARLGEPWPRTLPLVHFPSVLSSTQIWPRKMN